MTRPTRRRLERLLEDIEDSVAPDDTEEIVIREQVITTEHGNSGRPPGADRGDVVEESVTRLCRDGDEWLPVEDTDGGGDDE